MPLALPCPPGADRVFRCALTSRAALRSQLATEDPHPRSRTLIPRRPAFPAVSGIVEEMLCYVVTRAATLPASWERSLHQRPCHSAVLARAGPAANTCVQSRRASLSVPAAGHMLVAAGHCWCWRAEAALALAWPTAPTIEAQRREDGEGLPAGGLGRVASRWESPQQGVSRNH